MIALQSDSLLSKDNFKTIMELYEDDLPSPLSFDAELDLWVQHWNDESELASKIDTPGKTLPYADKDFYANINVLLRPGKVDSQFIVRAI